jgi:hypothetical protein
MTGRDEPHWLLSPRGVVFIGFLVVAGFYLWTEHRAHLYGALPFLLLLACPLMHLFMRRGHHGDHAQPSGRTNRGGEEK